VGAAGGVNGEILTAEQLAERWQVEKQHVYRLAREGKIPTIKLGRYYRFRADMIDAFERGEVAGTGEGAYDAPRTSSGRAPLHTTPPRTPEDLGGSDVDTAA
jgi:excisionase family DNA binding protein